LALESERPHRREALANLLWSEHPEAEARNSLRQALYQLRRILPPGVEKEPHLLITPNQVQFNPASDHWIDVIEFKQLLSTCLSRHPSDTFLCNDCLENLSRAIQLYQGDILAGFTLPYCETFTDWQVIKQEAYHRLAMDALALLAEHFESNQVYDQLIACAERKIELEPWRESAYRRQMRALAMTGQREQALQRYKSLQEILQRELGVAPTEGITRLYEQIRDGVLPGSRSLPGDWLTASLSASHPPAAATPIFVGRQSELAQLDCHLRDALVGHAQVAFVSGEAGSGKTAIMHAFASQAMKSNADLLVASGTCSAYDGLGDPYQPFRELMESLLGIIAAPCPDAEVAREYARRLDMARPVLLQILLETGPGLIGTLLPAQDLLQQARKTRGLDAALLTKLETLTARLGPGENVPPRPNIMKHSGGAEIPLMKTNLYNQVARLLQAVSIRSPLLILLDDMQWLDSASASLLFYLGGHLMGGRILLLGAYRLEDLVAVPGMPRHPLLTVLNEFQRRFGEIQVDLSQADGCAFVNAYLDSQPNRFDQKFREMLYRHTGGNALYTVELLLALQVRGEVAQDHGYWHQELPISWEPLPARVEAVLAEQLGRLDQDCLALLEAASLQSEGFTADVLARVSGVTEEQITTRLSSPLCKQHLLVRSLSLAEKDGNPQATYQFRSLVVQIYLYHSLGNVERDRLQRVTAHALGQERY
jgi:DNA-binding SARP family transcriptional activator